MSKILFIQLLRPLRKIFRLQGIPPPPTNLTLNIMPLLEEEGASRRHLLTLYTKYYTWSGEGRTSHLHLLTLDTKYYGLRRVASPSGRHMASRRMNPTPACQISFAGSSRQAWVRCRSDSQKLRIQSCHLDYNHFWIMSNFWRARKWQDSIFERQAEATTQACLR